MRLSRRFSLAVCLSGLLFSVCLPRVVDAQKVEIAYRSDFTGKQLFEHQWKWVPSDPKPIKVASFAIPRRPANATGTEMVLGVLGDGLGPLHNGNSCAQCHPAGGASGVEHNVTLISVDPVSPALHYQAKGGRDLVGLFPGLLASNGSLSFTTVVHNQSTRAGYEEIRQRLADHVAGEMDPTWFTPSERTVDAIAKQPVMAGRFASVDYYLSQRNSPPLYGLGEIDRINDDQIVWLASKQAKNSQGKITGRFVGKFGWRGQVNSLSAFVTQACATELGLNQISMPPASRTRRIGRSVVLASTPSIQQPGDPADFDYVNLGVDMDDDEVIKLTRFVAELPRPIEAPAEPYSFEQTLAGERLFNSIGCVDCHVADLDHLSGMFSDLLLHDMGPDLQGPDPAPMDPVAITSRVITVPTYSVRGPGRPNGSSNGYYGSSSDGQRLPKPYTNSRSEQAQFPRTEISSSQPSAMIDESWEMHQREWRTPPLWGVADTAPYLHDGRAATLEQAILWHGGESSESKERYVNLSASDQELVLAFLSSLRAPEMKTGEREE